MKIDILIILVGREWNYMIRAIAIDLDRTLLNDNNQIPERTLDIINKLSNAGFLIIIATGRPLRTVDKIVPEWFSKFYWITSNGAWIIKDNKILYRLEINHQDTMDIIKILSHEGLSPHIESNNQFFSDTELRTDILNFSYNPLDDFKGNACMVLAYIGNKNASLIENLLPSYVSMKLTNNNSMINIGRSGCDKSNSISWILKNENLSFDNLMAFGDDTNDLQMIINAKIGVAVSNAHIDLINVANLITKSNEEQGVGIILTELLYDTDVVSLKSKFT